MVAETTLHVDDLCRLAADGAHLHGVEEAQQRGLGGERDVGHLVEEERALVGLRGEASPAHLLAGVGEGASARGRRAGDEQGSGTAPQFSATNAPVRPPGVDVAAISLPVPVSPRTSTRLPPRPRRPRIRRSRAGSSQMKPSASARRASRRRAARRGCSDAGRASDLRCRSGGRRDRPRCPPSVARPQDAVAEDGIHRRAEAHVEQRLEAAARPDVEAGEQRVARTVDGAHSSPSGVTATRPAEKVSRYSVRGWKARITASACSW